MSASEEENEAFAAILYAEPGALGLIANIMAALVVAIENMLSGNESNMALTLAGVHLIIIGGFVQLLAGFMSYRRNDHLTGSAFIVFASLWTIHGINHILMIDLPLTIVQYGVLPGMIGFMAIAVILSICAATVNYIMPPVLVAIMITLVFEGLGLFFLWGRRVAAAFEIIIALSGIYGVVVMTLKGVSQRYILPGFGNAPYDVLLIRTKAPQSKKNEKKKNTKYAEPMGMGYIGNVVPAVVMAFHHLGYFSDFRPAIPMFLNSLLCHVCASYYAFLRHDFFNGTQFIIYSVFWTSKAINELLLTLDLPNIENLRINFYGQWALLVVMFILLVCSMCQSKVIYLYNMLFTLMVILSLDHIPRPVYNFTFGIPCCFVAFFSLFVSMSYLINSIAEKTVMYIGVEPCDMEKLRGVFERLTACARNVGAKIKYTEEGPHLDDEIVETLCFLSNGLACICLSPLEATQGTESLPWLIVAGAALQMYVARCAYASGSLAKAYMSTVYALYWMAWSTLLIDSSLSSPLRAAAIALLVLHTMGIFLTFTFTKIWMPFTLLFELNMIAFVVRCFGVQPPWMVLVTALLAGVIALYGTFAGMINGTLQGQLVPLGTPLLTEKQPDVRDTRKICPTFTSKRTSGILQAAKIINQGGIVGVPTDTVYALAASCKIPTSIKNIYHVKERPAEKPICVCLSNLDQLAEAKPDFSDLLWAFMRRCYPGGISCVVPKGEWMMNLGIGESVDYIGNKESVCIRVPDSSVLCYLVSLTGPVALSSANPSGGADSIHHDMVLDSLGHKIDGMVCDGESRELAPSTVVNCMNIDQGEITFFRIGCTPQEYVENLFKEAKDEVGSLSTSYAMALNGRPNKSIKF